MLRMGSSSHRVSTDATTHLSASNRLPQLQTTIPQSTNVISTLHHVIARAVPILQIQRPFGALVALLVSVFCAVPVYVYIERPVHRRLNELLLAAKCDPS